MTHPAGSNAGGRAYRPFTVPATNASVALQPTGALLLGGWSFAEDTGAAPATAQLVDGAASGGSVIAEIALPNGGAINCAAPAGGIEVRSGLSLVVLTGRLRGSVSVMRTRGGRPLYD